MFKPTTHEPDSFGTVQGCPVPIAKGDLVLEAKPENWIIKKVKKL